MFQPVDANVHFPTLEARILDFWRERSIYEKSLEARSGAPRFVFYEGPPTANGLPHPAHCLTRIIKDVFPRYRTMRGFFCERKAGWDTHGLPVEVEVGKELGIHSKAEIEQFGVEPFIHRCLESVFRYTKEWERLTERVGFWIHLDQAYVTYHKPYIESVWWALKNLFDRGLLYQRHKIVWWWAQGGTALSSGEVGQGYREVADPSAYVACPLVDEPSTALLIWTTTPWTLPNNQFVAVDADLEYAVCRVDQEDRRLIIALALVDTIAKKSGHELHVERTLRGRDLVGRRYVPPFDFYYRDLGEAQGALRAGGQQHRLWRVVAADFVTTESGTGLVHEAPAFGEVDYDLLLTEQARFVEGKGPPLLCGVASDGTFTDEVPDYSGRWVKEADRDILRALRGSGRLFHQEQYVHEYPFCWRADQDPLIQYPRKSWFIRTSQFKDEMLANNRRIGWLPEHIRDGRFGNFLESNVDWALSRERYWGTPLPIWVCEATGFTEAIGSYDELLAKPGIRGVEAFDEAKAKHPELSEHLRVHKPYIDEVTYDSPNQDGARMRRVPEVIDCWFDSGAMPFAQWGYPHTGRQHFGEQFPADFISEGIDQTRGWFYSQLAISTLLFGETSGDADPVARPRPYPHPFRNCIVLGLMLGEDGLKMSKSKKNYREPAEIFDRFGADAMRWYFLGNQPPWTSIRFSEQAIKESVPEFLLRLWNVYSFFVIYAGIDGFDPAAEIDRPVGSLEAADLARAKTYRPAAMRSELDRWILSELHRTAAQAIERMDAYDNYGAARRIAEFVDALSNWYVRRSRQRYWSAERTPEKFDAYWTLYECLLTLTRMAAPLVPFTTEEIWRNLAVSVFGPRTYESVHLCEYPTPEPGLIDEKLSAQMALVREVVSQGRAARMAAKLKVRQPLAQVEIILARPEHRAWLAEHADLICDELNVKRVEFVERADQYVTYTVLPDLKRLGPKLGKRLPALKQALASADPAALLAELDAQGQASLALPDGPLALDREDIQVRLQAKPGWTAAQGPSGVVVLSTEIDDALRAEGWVRELVHLVQNQRKELGCEYTDRIRLGVYTDAAELRSAVLGQAELIRGETLALEERIGPAAESPAGGLATEIDGHAVSITVEVAAS